MIMNNLHKLIPTYLALKKDVRRQKAYVKEVLEPVIHNASNSNDGSLEEDDFRKIRAYYGFGVPAIVGEGFCTLRGKAMSQRERKASTYQGALTGLYDDFFDKTDMAKENILSMMQDPMTYQPNTSLEKLFIHFLSEVNKNLSDQDDFNQAFMKVYESQIKSTKQTEEDLSFDQLKQITFDKGGNSLLFYRSIFDGKAGAAEEEAIYNTGALMQMGNDLFDVWKDFPQQVKTMVTDCIHIKMVRKVFRDQLNITIQSIERSGFPKKNITAYLHKLLLGISRCFVCMDQLEMLEQKSNGIFLPVTYSKEEMLCDMEKPRNIIRSINYYLGYPL
jgi:hypothetical protein